MHGSWPLKVSGTIWRSDLPDDPPDFFSDGKGGPSPNPYGRTPDEICALLVKRYGPHVCVEMLADDVPLSYRDGKRIAGVW